MFFRQTVTSECNKHTYGNWRQILHELKMEHLVDLVNKVLIIIEIFSVGLSVYRRELSSGDCQ